MIATGGGDGDVGARGGGGGGGGRGVVFFFPLRAGGQVLAAAVVAAAAGGTGVEDVGGQVGAWSWVVGRHVDGHGLLTAEGGTGSLGRGAEGFEGVAAAGHAWEGVVAGAACWSAGAFGFREAIVVVF